MYTKFCRRIGSSSAQDWLNAQIGFLEILEKTPEKRAWHSSGEIAQVYESGEIKCSERNNRPSENMSYHKIRKPGILDRALERDLFFRVANDRHFWQRFFDACAAPASIRRRLKTRDRCRIKYFRLFNSIRVGCRGGSMASVAARWRKKLDFGGNVLQKNDQK